MGLQPFFIVFAFNKNCLTDYFARQFLVSNFSRLHFSFFKYLSLDEIISQDDEDSITLELLRYDRSENSSPLSSKMFKVFKILKVAFSVVQKAQRFLQEVHRLGRADVEEALRVELQERPLNEVRDDIAVLTWQVTSMQRQLWDLKAENDRLAAIVERQESEILTLRAEVRQLSRC